MPDSNFATDDNGIQQPTFSPGTDAGEALANNFAVISTLLSSSSETVAAETARAESAEALLLPLAGGQMAGDIDLNGNALDNVGTVNAAYINLASGGFLNTNGAPIIVGTISADAGQITSDGNGDLTLSQLNANNLNVGGSEIHVIGSASLTLNLSDDTDLNLPTIGLLATTANISTHAALTATHGISSFIVGTSESQTLTNKIISGASNTISNIPQANVTGLTASLAALSPFAGSSSLTTLGTITTGTWHGSVIAGTYGGTGVNNGSSTITLGGNLATTGAFTLALALSGNTIVNVPTSGTLATTANIATETTRAEAAEALLLPITTAASTYSPIAGNSSLITLGTVTTGTWHGTIISPTFGGTGVNNGSNTITLAGNLATAGAFGLTITTTGTTNVTLPTFGTLLTITGAASTFSPIAGNTSLVTVGTVTTGTWNGSLISGTYGGTGVNNGSSTITLAGNLATSGANSLTLTTTGATNVTLPTSGTLFTTAGGALTGAITIGASSAYGFTSGVYQYGNAGISNVSGTGFGGSANSYSINLGNTSNNGIVGDLSLAAQGNNAGFRGGKITLTAGTNTGSSSTGASITLNGGGGSGAGAGGTAVIQTGSFSSAFGAITLNASGGNVLIGTGTDDGSHKLQVAGTAIVSGSLSSGASSPSNVSGTVTPDSTAGNTCNIPTLTANVTIANPTGTPVDGQTLVLVIVQNGTGGWTITFGTNYAFGTDITASMLPTAASSKYELGFKWNAADSKWRATGLARGF